MSDKEKKFLDLFKDIDFEAITPATYNSLYNFVKGYIKTFPKKKVNINEKKD